MSAPPVRRMGLVPAALLLGSVACNVTDDFTSPGADYKDLTSATVRSLQEAPLALAAANLVARAWPIGVTCPPSFDLGSVGSGSCVAVEIQNYYYTGTYTSYVLQMDGRVPGAGSTLQIPFELRVTPLEANEYTIEVWRVVANVTTGNGAWSVRGSGLTNGAGTPIDTSLLLHTSMGEWRVHQGRLECVQQGAEYVNARIDAASGTGTLSVGVVVANVQVTDGCVTVDFLDVTKEDQHSCQW